MLAPQDAYTTWLLDPEILAERAAILAVENGWPDSYARARAVYWHTWTPEPPPPPSTLTYARWPLRPAWAQTLLQLPAYGSAALALRPYQREAVEAAYAAWHAGESVVLDLATGAGKSLVIAELCRRIPGRILVLTHRAELLEQNSGELRALMGDSADYGLYCAGLRRKDTTARVVFASIASIYRSEAESIQARAFTAILVDEAHRIPFRTDRDGLPSISMYAQYFAPAPLLPPLIGLTATPSRMGVPIYGHPAAWFARVAARASMADLTPQHLLPLVPIQGVVTIDTRSVHTVAGEYNQRELSAAASEASVVRAAVAEICTYAPEAGGKSWLVFCVDQAHCAIVGQAFLDWGITVGVLTDKTPRAERQQMFRRMQAGELTCLVNCEIATTGSNIPRLDCLVILRPTRSKELFVQMLGRGTRQYPGLERCIVMDYTDNSILHAPLDGVPAIAENPRHQAAREEAEERARKAAEEAEETEERERPARHAHTLAGIDPPSARRYSVTRIRYTPTRTKDGSREMLIVDYTCPERPQGPRLRIWVCPQHPGRGRAAAREWLVRRLPRPTEVESILDWEMTTLARVLPRGTTQPQEITVDETGDFPRIVAEKW
jgi:DNA repair protein RadD